MPTDLQFQTLAGLFAVCRLNARDEVPEWATMGDALSVVARTRDELSIVVEARYVPQDVRVERDWRALRVRGVLDFALVGVLARITTALAEANVSVFAVSTFDTDYVLVRDQDFAAALGVLGG